MISGSKDLINSTDDYVHAYWILTRKCNYKCHYCVCPTMAMNPPDATDEVITKTIEAYNYLDKISPVNLTITGGEPTLKDLHSILQRLSLRRSVTIYTNLSATVDYYISLNTVHPIKIHSTLHLTQVAPSEFVLKCNNLCKDMPVLVKLMVTDPKTLVIARETLAKLHKNVVVEIHTAGVTSKEIITKTLRMNTHTPFLHNNKEISAYGLSRINSFKSWTCTAPKKAICIDYYGAVYTCKAHFQDNKPLGFTIFDDFEAEYGALGDTIQCPITECTSDLEVIKYK